MPYFYHKVTNGKSVSGKSSLQNRTIILGTAGLSVKEHSEFTAPFQTASRRSTFCITETREREICMLLEKYTCMFSLSLSSSTCYCAPLLTLVFEVLVNFHTRTVMR